ncbi:3252_t:CDS:2 [Diversispora eburnea]|uniref:3252_t:CDS:1 n=1 Tax=Diversispora eburnea TaxID=1213867 RepID=A0A9N8V1L8_9GLOM|nr:3252_t:CDS:2 [Diversispora eburnea]
MSCYGDMIVKVNQVCQSDKEDTKLTVVLGLKIMTVTSSTHFMIKKDLGSNKYPLKVSLIGITQDIAKEINNENAMVKVLVKNYVGQSSNFIVMIVFLYCNSQFKHLINSTRPNESLLFIVEHLKVIQDDLYVYTVETSFINTYSNVSESLTEVPMIENSDRGEEVNQFVIDSSASDFHLSKCIKTKNKDKCVTEQNTGCMNESNVPETNTVSENKRRGVVRRLNLISSLMPKHCKVQVKLIEIGSLVENIYYGPFSHFWWKLSNQIPKYFCQSGNVSATKTSATKAVSKVYQDIFHNGT